MRRHLVELSPGQQAVAFQRTKGFGQHALSHAGHLPFDLGMAHRAVHTQSMEDAQRPTAAGVSENFATHAIIVSSERLADRFCLAERLLISHFFTWYHACAFF